MSIVALSSRQRDILLTLLQSHGQALSARELGRQLGLSPRIVRSQLKHIDLWLDHRGSQLTVRPHFGIRLHAEEGIRQKLLDELQSMAGYSLVLSPRDRRHKLLYRLLNCDEPLVSKELARELGVSRTTVLKDMDWAEQWLAVQNLQLIRRPNFGFQINGEECDLREAIVSLLLESLGEQFVLQMCLAQQDTSFPYSPNRAKILTHDPLLESQEWKYAKELVLPLRQTMEPYMNDISAAVLALHLAVLIKRVSKGHYVGVSSPPPDDQRWAKVLHIATVLADHLHQQIGVPLPQGDIEFMARQLSGSRFLGESENSWQPGPQVSNAVDVLLSEAALYLHPLLRVDELLHNRLSLHLTSAFHRLALGLPIRNPFLDEVRERYPYEFRIARRSRVALEQAANCTIPEDEIGFVAMHFAAAMSRVCQRPKSRRNVLVVCGFGRATARLLVSRLRAEFPDLQIAGVMSACEMEKIEELTGAVDAVISTVPLKVPSVPVIIVRPLLRPDDVDRIRTMFTRESASSPRLYEYEGKDEPGISLDALITLDTIALNVQASGWQDAVERAGNVLLRRGDIEPGYISAMKANIMQYGPYVVVMPGVALLHARPEDGANRLSMALVTLNPPARFGHTDWDPVDVALVLAAIDERSHLRALGELISLLRDTIAINRIRIATDGHKVLRAIAESLQRTRSSKQRLTRPLPACPSPLN